MTKEERDLLRALLVLGRAWFRYQATGMGTRITSDAEHDRNMLGVIAWLARLFDPKGGWQEFSKWAIGELSEGDRQTKVRELIHWIRRR